MSDPKRLDIARWTPAGFKITDEFRALAAADAMVAVETVRICDSRILYIGTGRLIRDSFPCVRLVIARGNGWQGPPDITIATLRRDNFCAPQWERTARHRRPVPTPHGCIAPDVELTAIVETPVLSDVVTLDATAPGWREGDVVAVVGEAPAL